jgi:salicylate hydroxylase
MPGKALVRLSKTPTSSRTGSRHPVDALVNFRRVRIPRVHGVQRLSLAYAPFKHMRGSAAQKESIASGTGSVHGNSEWVWGYDPVGDWKKEPFVPPDCAA